jgi:hypothetical protein
VFSYHQAMSRRGWVRSDEDKAAPARDRRQARTLAQEGLAC